MLQPLFTSQWTVPRASAHTPARDPRRAPEPGQAGRPIPRSRVGRCSAACGLAVSRGYALPGSDPGAGTFAPGLPKCGTRILYVTPCRGATRACRAVPPPPAPWSGSPHGAPAGAPFSVPRPGCPGLGAPTSRDASTPSRDAGRPSRGSPVLARYACVPRDAAGTARRGWPRWGPSDVPGLRGASALTRCFRPQAALPPSRDTGAPLRGASAPAHSRLLLGGAPALAP